MKNFILLGLLCLNFSSKAQAQTYNNFQVSHSDTICDSSIVFGVSPHNTPVYSPADIHITFDGDNFLGEELRFAIEMYHPTESSTQYFLGTPTAIGQEINWTPEALGGLVPPQLNNNDYYNYNYGLNPGLVVWIEHVDSDSLLYIDTLVFNTGNCYNPPIDTTCLEGIVFCDLNENGIYDGTTDSVYTNWSNFIYDDGIFVWNDTSLAGWSSLNSNGQFFIQILDENANNIDVNFSTNWSDQSTHSIHPNYNPNIPDSIDLSCETTVYVHEIPLICPADTINLLSDSLCIEGIVFCDLNENGVYDAGADSVYTNESELNYSDGIFALNNNYLGGWSSLNNNGEFFIQVWEEYVNNIEVNFSGNWSDQSTHSLHPSYNANIPDSIDLNCATTTYVHEIPLICPTDTIIINPPSDSLCIEGIVFCDLNGNGIYDGATDSIYTNESGFNYDDGIFAWNNGNQVGWSSLNNNGEFFIQTWDENVNDIEVNFSTNWSDQSTHSIHPSYNPNIPDSIDLNCATTSYVHEIPLICPTDTLDPIDSTQCVELESNIILFNEYFQENNSNILFVAYNNTPQPTMVECEIQIEFPSVVTVDESSIDNSNYTINGNVLTYQGYFGPYSYSTSDQITFYVPAGIADSTIHNYTMTVTPLNYDECDSTDNVHTEDLIVGVSYDPNDKSVNLPTELDGDIQEELIYRIRFQNTGTAPAQNVYILDTLSENLDWSTFRFMNTSHEVDIIHLANNVVKFDYPQIWLPDSTTNEPESHGYVQFAIKEKADIELGDEIENTAHIFFDHNEAIVTNTTFNVNPLLAGVSKIEDHQVSIYPNPAEDVIHIQMDLKSAKYSIVSVDGRIVQSGDLNQSLSSINVSELAEGSYSILLNGENIQSMTRFIKN